MFKFDNIAPATAAGARSIGRHAVMWIAGVSFMAAAASAVAQDQLPPTKGKKLSEIVASVEQRAGFRYIEAVDWQSDSYTVTYFTTDKAKVEIKFDPVSGEPKDM